ncbi:MAG: hypothetical protein MRQ11_04965 [Candidatus Midichloria mitochondrii]|nr:hypothetical protein [Candidatus Midichloria mitochondrii]MDJ1313422.1 hypothetical protein [Candidatus Midichloria mitochondrii]MDJ1584017.1 hypothetical protein [Candidatus Midichloria mitochondrii]
MNCCKGKQTATVWTQQRLERFVITYVLAVIRSLKASLSVGKFDRPSIRRSVVYKQKH